MSKKSRVLKTVFALALAVVTVVTSAEIFGSDMASVSADGRSVSITSCSIQGGNVVCQLSASTVPGSDDGNYYIYADDVCQDGCTGTVVATCPVGGTSTASFPVNYGGADSVLSKKFLVAVKKGGSMIQVSNEHYITNPEAASAGNAGRMNVGIKGILPDMNKFTDVLDLGCQQIVFNISMDQICADASVGGAIAFNYAGGTYYFNPTIIGNYDAMVKNCNNNGIAVTLALLNDGTGAYSQDLVHPQARGAECPSYAINVTSTDAVNHFKAVAAFLGQRYNGSQGQVDNWILGNEVNARTSWWYLDSSNLEVNVVNYVKAYRIFYNELKAGNSSCNVYISLDQEWGRKSNPGSFLSKDYLDRFNYYMAREGNIDWGLSFHPYNSPLYDPYAWNGPAVWVQNNTSTKYMTMQNINVLIDYMHQASFLNPAGQCRSISIAEVGYTSSFGTELQEASVAYGYLKAASCPDIDAFMLFRQTDDAHEMESHLALGLNNADGSHKPAYAIYKALGTGNAASAKARASEIIGMDIDQMISQNIIWTRAGDGVVQ